MRVNIYLFTSFLALVGLVFTSRLLYPVHRYSHKRPQAANLRGFSASMNHRFEVGILDFMDGIPDFMGKFYILMCYCVAYTEK